MRDIRKYKGVRYFIEKKDRGYVVIAGDREVEGRIYYRTASSAESAFHRAVNDAKQWRRYPDVQGFGKISQYL